MSEQPEPYIMPPNAHSPDVPMTGAEAQLRYDQAMRELDAGTPTPEQATQDLAKAGLDPSKWPGIMQEGAREDNSHTRRALIMIAQRDPRPLGQISHELRKGAVKDGVDPTVARRVQAFARQQNPVTRKPRRGHYF